MNAAHAESAATRGAGATGPPPAVGIYVTVVVVLAFAANAFSLVGADPVRLEVVAVWAAFAALSQLLVFPTVTRSGEVTIGTVVHLSMMTLLPPAAFLPALWLSRIVVNGLFHKKPWYRALFNACQVTLAVLLASLTYRALGGTHALEPSVGALVRTAPGFLAGALVYYVVNMALVAGVLALSRGESMWRAWRANYGYPAEILGTVGLVMLAPIAVICDVLLGPWGLALFLVPMVFVRDASRRYVELRRTQEALIGAERLAAKGELAAQVGHEINNYLSVIEGQLSSARSTDDPGERDRRLETAREQTLRIRQLTRGLLEFNQRSNVRTRTDLCDLFRRTSDWVSHQRCLDGIVIHQRLDPRLGDVTVDPGQMQQLFMNLLLNAAHAINESDAPRREISVWLDRNELAGVVEIGVADTGPGIPPDLRSRIFTPGFTTRERGHGYGLAAAQAIVQAHQGRITVGQGTEGGAQFLIALPFEAIGLERRPPGGPAQVVRMPARDRSLDTSVSLQA